MDTNDVAAIPTTAGGCEDWLTRCQERGDLSANSVKSVKWAIKGLLAPLYGDDYREVDIGGAFDSLTEANRWRNKTKETALRQTNLEKSFARARNAYMAFVRDGTMPDWGTGKRPARAKAAARADTAEAAQEATDGLTLVTVPLRHSEGKLTMFLPGDTLHPEDIARVKTMLDMYADPDVEPDA